MFYQRLFMDSGGVEWSRVEWSGVEWSGANSFKPSNKIVFDNFGM